MSEVLQDIFRRIYQRINTIENKLDDVESEHGEIAGFHFGNLFPGSPYPNQIVVRTDQTPPDGGAMYRWDENVGAWLRLN